MQTYAHIHAGRLYEKIVEQIEERIVSGKLKIGEQLPAERELAVQFGVSRTAVREAVKTLRQKGLVEIAPGRGTFIADQTSSGVRHSLGLMMKITAEDGYQNLVEVREILEPEIAARAASHATAEHLASMRQAITTMDAALDDADAYIEADLDFHLALAHATQNDLVPTLLDPIVHLLRENRKRIFNRTGAPQRGQVYHKRILRAIEQRDPETARKQMRAHLAQVRRDSNRQ
ncbi:HTH-type transcriptional regulator LutR [Anaerolineae bacterium]|nr:HTH-type transcriptional regulator LutR [Anaerolineae bacterium]